MSSLASRPEVGSLLRDWRQRRHLSQLELALRADVSSRHISFVETGRARPSADMVKHIAEVLDVPLRERNSLLLAAGFAPAYSQRDLEDPDMKPVRAALEHVLRAHEPYPAVVVDRHWGMIAANEALTPLITGVAAHLLEPPVNVLRLSLHPEGVAPRIINLGEWRAHILARLGRQAVVSGDPALFALHEELAAYPSGERTGHVDLEAGTIAVPLRLASDAGELAFISTATSFGAPADVTVSELTIESFYPADEYTASALAQQA
jgi:transcriptional regulator with XRE-family HTH domain